MISLKRSMFCSRLCPMLLCLRSIALMASIVICLPYASAVEGGHLLSEDDLAFRSLIQLIAISQRNGTIYACSGAFISPTLVVTAAHCITDDKSGKLLKNF